MPKKIDAPVPGSAACAWCQPNRGVLTSLVPAIMSFGAVLLQGQRAVVPRGPVD